MTSKSEWSVSGSKVTSRSTSLSGRKSSRSTEPNSASSAIRQRRHSSESASGVNPRRSSATASTSVSVTTSPGSIAQWSARRGGLLVDVDLGAVRRVDAHLPSRRRIGASVHVQIHVLGLSRLCLHRLGGLDVLLDVLLGWLDDGVGGLDRALGTFSVLGLGVLHLTADDAFVGHADSSWAPFAAALMEGREQATCRAPNTRRRRLSGSLVRHAQRLEEEGVGIGLLLDPLGR